LILVVALVVLGPEQMPVVARGLLKIIRELRAAADDTLSEIRQSLEEPAPSEYTQWKPPGHQQDESQKQAGQGEGPHPAGPEPRAADETSPAEGREANLEAAVSDQASNAERLHDRGEPPTQARPSEAEQIWESTDAAEPADIAGLHTASESPEQAKPCAAGQGADSSEHRQAPENRPALEDILTATTAMPPASAPTVASEAPLEKKLEAAREEEHSASSESSEPVSGKSQPPHSPT
jgi:Sec-independent protein translocase protein TatA